MGSEAVLCEDAVSLDEERVLELEEKVDESLSSEAACAENNPYFSAELIDWYELYRDDFEDADGFKTTFISPYTAYLQLKA